ncbi:hypothetical protein [Halobacteriovorax sp. HLS]|uniref:hypothetical protein n=1 Tax=Halobacteriovorax sp. HLS TaxID=2234000 RepID=UPI000FD95AF7|nr:hypothetical protein [Halobacteriovorax sp. HLS]
MKIFIFLLLFPLSSLASSICDSHVEFFENMRIQTGSFKSNECYISISPRKTYEMKYRNFLLTSSGRFLVFNSYGQGPSNEFSGAREFNFFPRATQLTYEVSEREVVVTLVNGDKLVFDKEIALPISLTNAIISVDEDIIRGNAGGVEILNYQRVLIDFGFQMGMSPTWYLKRKATVIDEFNAKCSITNSEILYKKNSDVYWQYDTDRLLFSYLNKRCPLLNLPD